MSEIKIRYTVERENLHLFTRTFSLEQIEAGEAVIFFEAKNIGEDTKVFRERFTGSYVRNGKEIYEGDILYFTVFDCFDNDTQYTGVVNYEGSRYLLKNPLTEFGDYKFNVGPFDLDWVVSQDDEIEIIGNIHENKELLNV